MKRFKTSVSSAGVRADVFVSSKYPEYARSALLKLFAINAVAINGAAARPGYKLKVGDKITLDESLLTQPTPTIELDIIYEDRDVIVINKPTGVLSHANGNLNTEASVASFVRSKVSEELKSSGQRAGIVHRLDRATSGVMLCAKNKAAMSFLQKQFGARKVKKTYTAICVGKLAEPEATIDVPISRQSGKKSHPFWVNPKGKPSITAYKLAKQKNQAHWLKLTPLTGRTHQIRVHMAFLGCPVAGDQLYGGFKTERLMLHAEALEVTLPSGERKIFKASTPKEFVKFWNSLK